MPDRLTFKEFVLERLPGTRCRSKVVLSLSEDATWQGEAEGLASQAGELRTAADASVAALTKFINGAATLELLGVKAVKAFDNNVIIVSMAYSENGRSQRLVGCFLAETDSARGAALAVLNATNRVLGNRFFMR